MLSCTLAPTYHLTSKKLFHIVRMSRSTSQLCDGVVEFWIFSLSSKPRQAPVLQSHRTTDKEYSTRVCCCTSRPSRDRRHLSKSHHSHENRIQSWRLLACLVPLQSLQWLVSLLGKAATYPQRKSSPSKPMRIGTFWNQLSFRWSYETRSGKLKHRSVFKLFFLAISINFKHPKSAISFR